MEKINGNLSDTSYFDTIVKTIIDADDTAKNIVNTAKKQYEDVNAVARERLADYRKKQFEIMDKRLSEYRKNIENKTEATHNSTVVLSDKSFSDLNENVQKNKDKWVTDIFNAIVTP